MKIEECHLWNRDKPHSEGIYVSDDIGGPRVNVRIYDTDRNSIFGAVSTAFSNGRGWKIGSWHIDNGKSHNDGLDLYIAPRTIELDFWVNVYNLRGLDKYMFSDSRPGADSQDAVIPNNRLACINIKMEVAEGEGL